MRDLRLASSGTAIYIMRLLYVIKENNNPIMAVGTNTAHPSLRKYSYNPLKEDSSLYRDIYPIMSLNTLNTKAIKGTVVLILKSATADGISLASALKLPIS